MKIEVPIEFREVKRLDQFLGELDDIPSRSAARQMIEKDFVRVNGKNEKRSYLIQAKDIIEVNVPVLEQPNLDPYDFPLNVVFEDDHLIVVNKPAGIVVHPSPGHHSTTIVNALIHRGTTLAKSANELRPGIVHRIDKDTSGLIVVAKTESVLEDLANQFRAKTVQRKYLAIVHGLYKVEGGTYKTNLRRHQSNRMKFASVSPALTKEGVGKPAVTHFKVLDEGNSCSLVQFQLETGRTHQIRVHSSEHHHPILGDVLYGAGNLASRLKKEVKNLLKEFNRVALHAQTLGFVHPVTQEDHLYQVAPPERMMALALSLEFDMKVYHNDD